MDRNIIFGQPGTGKTTHLLRIVEKELRENNVAPNRIAYLAFTNQAADEALSRAISQLNYDIKDFSNFRTLHSFCLLYTSPSPRDRTRSRMPSSA